jgi:hypothetical protein
VQHRSPPVLRHHQRSGQGQRSEHHHQHDSSLEQGQGPLGGGDQHASLGQRVAPVDDHLAEVIGQLTPEGPLELGNLVGDRGLRPGVGHGQRRRHQAPVLQPGEGPQHQRHQVDAHFTLLDGDRVEQAVTPQDPEGGHMRPTGQADQRLLRRLTGHELGHRLVDDPPDCPIEQRLQRLELGGERTGHRGAHRRDHHLTEACRDGGLHLGVPDDGLDGAREPVAVKHSSAGPHRQGRRKERHTGQHHQHDGHHPAEPGRAALRRCAHRTAKPRLATISRDAVERLSV